MATKRKKPPKSVKAWAIFSPHMGILARSIFRQDIKEPAYVKQKWAGSKNRWRQSYRLGYRCVPVKITRLPDDAGAGGVG